MRKIVAGLFVSLDGVVESPEKWHFPYLNDEMAQIIGDQMKEADAMLLGRRTYEEFAAYWPNPEPQAADLAGYMNGTPKHVVTTTLRTAGWQNSTIVRGDVPAALKELKERPGKDISITGSPTLVRSLLAGGLLDELRLLIHPIVVGWGAKLFTDGEQVPLRLLDSRTLETGVIHATYGRA
ncbi:dihydrofolate reductase family protein [Nonomuraea sp. SMC257]|uniref:Dihydrofolate reductase family protein n=1 Tax=Nonomuraea montanisoli TaxID=2741721 RepID=A0A7Y6I7I3_9ACTN|nr:dihydrofolate reductase family protein [Nonomuraea montanisoli]NUW33132.1 dihydrofolate reductase family protein [Nonomuraea montanisoli]